MILSQTKREVSKYRVYANVAIIKNDEKGKVLITDGFFSNAPFNDIESANDFRRECEFSTVLCEYKGGAYYIISPNRFNSERKQNNTKNQVRFNKCVSTIRLSNCCAAKVIMADSNGDGKCSDCKENCTSE